MPRVSVYVVDYGRKFLQLQWIDPLTGKRRTKSSGTTRRREAERAAADHEKLLNAGLHDADGSIPWREWRERIELEATGGLKSGTRKQISGILNSFERSASPGTLADLNPMNLSTHVATLRDAGRSEDTIKSHLRHLRSLLVWSVDQGLIAALPAIPKIRRARKGKEMKGRPITLVEFRRMLKAISKVVPDESHRPAWRRLLIGLWLSGLRLEESLQLSWTPGNNISIELSPDGDRVRLRIPGEHQKSGEDQLYPVAPAFTRWLLKTPESQRTGWVFSPIAKSGGRLNNRSDVGRMISAIGKQAGAVVHERYNTDGTSQKKFASAHDLRRAFGTRYALKVMPTVLQKMMRHEDISTTMKYYVRLEVEETERVLYGKPAKRRHNTQHNTRQKDDRKSKS